MKVAVDINKHIIIDVLPDTVTCDSPYLVNNRYLLLNMDNPIKETKYDLEGNPYFEFVNLPEDVFSLLDNSGYSVYKKEIVKNSTVEYKGVLYQSDEVSQERMSRAIQTLSEPTSSIKWVTKDNSIQELLRDDLVNILKLAFSKQNEVWVKP